MNCDVMSSFSRHLAGQPTGPLGGFTTAVFSADLPKTYNKGRNNRGIAELETYFTHCDSSVTRWAVEARATNQSLVAADTIPAFIAGLVVSLCSCNKDRW